MATQIPSAAIGVPVGILAVTGVASLVRPDLGGIIGGLIWGCLLVMPTLVFQRVSTLIHTQQFKQAASWSQTFQWIYQLYSLPEVPPLLKAVDLAAKGQTGKANSLLEQHKQTQAYAGRVAIAEIYRLEGRWADLLKWSQDTLWISRTYPEPNLALSYLRALGEEGDLNALVLGFHQLSPIFEQTQSTYLASGQLLVLAFCGYPDQVRRLFLGPLSGYPLALQHFWVTTAELVIKPREPLYQQLRALRGSSSSLDRSIALRLSRSLADPRSLTPEALDIVHQIQIKPAPRPLTLLSSGEIPYITYSLVGLNLVMFGFELALGGSENLQVLFELGALVPAAVVQGSWWRLGTATLLHFGITHLSMNMLGLLFLGPFVERGLGIFRYLVVYWGAGIGSMLTITFLWLLGLTQSDFVVGASGSIMGLIGSAAIILLSMWYRHKSQVALRHLRKILLIIGLQIVFDLTSPQISFIGHLSGLIIGSLLTAALLTPDLRQPAQVTPP